MKAYTVKLHVSCRSETMYFVHMQICI